MFDKLKNRIGNLESETAELKAELAKTKIELADTKRLFTRLTGEIAALRRQTDSIVQLGGIVPAFPVVRKTNLPTDSGARGTETS
jgi:septal ring factor EnvC (AmiA/AmiB activator)